MSDSCSSVLWRPVASSLLCCTTLYLVFGAGVGALDTTATATLPTGRGAKGDRLATTGLAASCFRFGAAGAFAGFAAAACLRGAGALATFFAPDAVLAIGLAAFFAVSVAGAFFRAALAGAGFAAFPAGPGAASFFLHGPFFRRALFGRA